MCPSQLGSSQTLRFFRKFKLVSLFVKLDHVPKDRGENIKINTTTETNISVEVTTTSSKQTPFWTASDALLAPERRRFKSSRLGVRHFSRAMGQPLKYIQIEGVKQVLTTPLWVDGDNRRSIENHSNTSSKKDKSLYIVLYQQITKR